MLLLRRTEAQEAISRGRGQRPRGRYEQGKRKQLHRVRNLHRQWLLLPRRLIASLLRHLFAQFRDGREVSRSGPKPKSPESQRFVSPCPFGEGTDRCAPAGILAL